MVKPFKHLTKLSKLHKSKRQNYVDNLNDCDRTILMEELKETFNALIKCWGNLRQIFINSGDILLHSFDEAYNKLPDKYKKELLNEYNEYKLRIRNKSKIKIK